LARSFCPCFRLPLLQQSTPWPLAIIPSPAQARFTLTLPSHRSPVDFAQPSLHHSISTFRQLTFGHHQIHRHSIQASHRLCLSSKHLTEPFDELYLTCIERTATWRNMGFPASRQFGSIILAMFSLPSTSAKHPMAPCCNPRSRSSKICLHFALASTTRLPDVTKPPPLSIGVSPAHV
jgi:hypothetical protein